MEKNNEKSKSFLWTISPLHKEQVEAIKAAVTRTGISRLPKKYLAVVAAGAILLTGFGASYELSNANKAYALQLNGHQIAIVEDDVKAQETINQVVNEKSKDLGQKVTVTDQIGFRKTRAKNISLDGTFNLKRKLIKSLNFATKATSIKVNGQEKLVLLNKKTAQKVLDDLAKSYVSDYKNAQIAKIEYVDKVDLPEKEISLKKITNEAEAVKLLRQGSTKVSTYTVGKGESSWTIARKNNMLVKEIQEANPGINVEKLKPGQVINLARLEPMVNIKVYFKATVTESIAFDIKTVNDNSLNSGQQKVSQTGQAGSKDVTYDLITNNTVLVQKNAISQNVTKAPKTQIVSKGTKVIVASRGGTWNGGGSGILAWPVRGPIPAGGYFNSSRGSHIHGAIDIDAPIGTPIGAAANGTVTQVGWQSGYGNAVTIDHGNGLVTHYAHMSGFNTSVGATVSRGQIIGYVGMTGNATGPHLDFTVILNGSAVNPLGFL